MCSVIKHVSSYKMLDVYVSQDLSWDTHIEYVYDKVNKPLHNLRLLKRAGFSLNDLVRIYCALIKSVLEYVSPVCSSLTLYLSNHIESIKKRALRIILGANYISYQDALISPVLRRYFILETWPVLDSSRKLEPVKSSHFILLSLIMVMASVRRSKGRQTCA